MEEIIDKAHEQLSCFWQERINKHGNRFEVVGWTEDSQRARFKAALEIGDLNNKTILDIGCGRGDLYSFLKSQKIDADYHGVDLTPEMISFCKELYPEISDSFEVLNILKESPAIQPDYIFCIGVLNQFTGEDSPEFATLFIERLFKIAKCGVAVAITSSNAPRMTEDTFYFSPWNMLERASTITPKIRLDHTYLQNDFTLFLYH